MPDRRERALREGVETLPDVDLLALVLGTGASGEPAGLLAASLLESEGSLEAVARSSPHGLAERRGIGPAKAARLAAAFELGRRVHIGTLGNVRLSVRGHAEVVAWAHPRLAGLEHEEVWLLSLDGGNALKSARRIARGGAHASALTTRDVLSPALRDGASAIVLVHNHPSGDPRPSLEDIAMTRALAAACELVGLPLLDHVVVARGGSASLFEEGAP
ncbi:MAG: DNA repair protein RadC [Pseudomonadota bacterium]|nr:MAG: DNA repair protein [Pseudomonadota bacterium]